MLPDFLSGGVRVLLSRLNPGRRQKMMPGSIEYEQNQTHLQLKLRVYSRFLFSISYRSFISLTKQLLRVTERNNMLRFEALMAVQGKSNVIDTDIAGLLPGQYQISDERDREISLQADETCHFFVAHYSEEWLEQAGIKEFVRPGRPRPLTTRMAELIRQMLHNPYEDHLQQFHYENCIRDLMLQHLVNSGYTLPGVLSDRDEAAIFSADSIIQQDLQSHILIPQLAEKVGINENKLKKGFRLLFDMGVFERLTWHRMEVARHLLESTDRTIDAVATEVGYTTRNSFITSFRKQFSITPKQYRKRFKLNQADQNEGM